MLNTCIKKIEKKKRTKYMNESYKLNQILVKRLVFGAFGLKHF